MGASMANFGNVPPPTVAPNPMNINSSAVGPQPIKGQGQNYVPMPRYSNEQTYQNMMSRNGGAPTSDMISGINAIGRPLHLMKHHQEQAINNRRGDVESAYKEMMGRGVADEEREYWMNSGKVPSQMRSELESNQEYQDLIAKGLRKAGGGSTSSAAGGNSYASSDEVAALKQQLDALNESYNNRFNNSYHGG